MGALTPKKAVVAAGVVLALVTVLSLARVVMLQPPPARPPSPASLQAISIPLPEATVEETAQFVERPLFWAARRPLDAAAAAPAPVVSTSSAYQGPSAVPLEKAKLLGLYAVSDTVGGVILLDGGARRRLAVNDEFHGWTLTAVRNDRAVFSATVRAGDTPLTREIALEHALLGAGPAKGGNN